MFIYYLLDWILIVFHVSVILFSLTGWIWRKTRRWHLLILGITAFSWFVPGLWYGIGYCFLTDWHWQVRTEIGYHDMPYSFIKFILDNITGYNWNAGFVDILTGICFGVTLIISLVVNIYPNFKQHRP